jgi:hypothetical protein
MNRLTLSILLSFTVVITVTALNYTPDTTPAQTCKVGVACNNPDCCQKVPKACGTDFAKPCCQKVTKACGTDCTKPCCANKPIKQCGPNCTKPCCAKT